MTLTTAWGDRPVLTATWTDEITGARGYLVVDRLVNGVASGGLRMRRGVTVDEVADLALAMTVKEAIAHRPGLRRPLMGGAKGGIDCDPEHPDASGVLERYLRAMRPLCEQYWSFGEDLGLRQEQVDVAAAAVGLDSTLVAAYPLLSEPPRLAMTRVDDAFAVVDEGVSIGDLVGGLGVAETALTALARTGTAPGAARAVVQGFGSIGGATARFLSRAGVRVVAIADAVGTVVDDDGLDVEVLLAHRDPLGRLDRARLPGSARALPGDAWLDVPADVVVPAAVSYCIGAPEAARLRTNLVVEGANLPVTAEGEAALAARGAVVVPDVVANSATNSWWWWVFFGDVADPSSRDESYDLVRREMQALTVELLDTADELGLSPRAASRELAERRTASARKGSLP